MYKLILAIRYLYRRRVSYFALIAVALCVFIVVVVMTVMSGLVGEFREKNHSFTGDCVVGTESLVGFTYYEDFLRKLESTDCVEAASAVIKSYALVGKVGSQRNMGVEIIGIDAATYGRATGFGGTLHYHKDDVSRAFKPTAVVRQAHHLDANLPGFVVGVDMWIWRDEKGEYYFAPNPEATAVTITCFPLTARGALAKAGTDLVNTKTFYFSDTSHSGIARVDGSVIYAPFEDAQALCGMKEPIARASWIHIKFKPMVGIDKGCGKVRKLWGTFYEQNKDKPNGELLAQVKVQGWKEHRREFIAAMEKEQVMLTVMFGLVGLTTIFIVFVVFYMIVSHKTKDIGILKSVGASGCDVVELFLGFAAGLGVIGSAVGIAFGLWFLRDINAIEDWLFERFGFQLWDRTIYAIGEIPHRADLTMMLVVAGCAVLACVAGAALPSVRAAKERPVETLQVSQI
ncbi:MAG: ABC transporter permease [Sedimentisphaerales bacterium]|nr:ABC transporter permease [Sedimentisphaerales bacterium]